LIICRKCKGRFLDGYYATLETCNSCHKEHYLGILSCPLYDVSAHGFCTKMNNNREYRKLFYHLLKEHGAGELAEYIADRVKEGD
jgi:hypothetical protein